MYDYKLEYYTKKKYDIRNVSKDEYTEFIADKNYIMFYLHFEELYSILKYNFGDFWTYLFELTESSRMNSFADLNEYIEPMVVINQKLLNILSSFKSYLDIILSQGLKHPTIITNTKSDFDELYSKMYDKYFGFRFMSRLRNYSQHYKLPIQIIGYTSEVINEKEGHIAYTVEPQFNRDELLQFDNWSTVYSEIEIMDEQIKCKPILGELYLANSQLHKALRGILHTQYTNVKGRMMTIVSEANEHYGRLSDDAKEKAIYFSIYDSDKLVENNWLPEDVMSRIDRMVVKNQCDSHYNYTYSTMRIF